MDSSETDKIESENEPTTTEAAQAAITPSQTEEVLGLEMMSFGGKTYIATSILAQKFGYDGDHIARLARQGKVESIKQGKKWFVLKESLEDYRKKADINKRIVASESIKTARSNALKETISRGPKLVPSLALFQIAERIIAKFRAVEESDSIISELPQDMLPESLRARRASSRSPFNGGFKLALLALFLFMVLSTVPINEGSPLSAFFNPFSIIRNWFQSQTDSTVLNTEIDNLKNELENLRYTIVGASSNGRDVIIRETIQTRTEQISKLSQPEIESRLTVLEKFISESDNKFNDIDSRLRLTPTILSIPSGKSIDNTSTVTSSYTIDSNTILARTLTLSGSGSVTENFEVSGYASASQLFGAGLSDCDAATDTLNWDTTTGKFSCGADSGAGTAEIKIEKSGTTVLATTQTLNFDDGHFSPVSSGATETIVRLDWDSAGGPASLSQNETVTGLWNFSSGASFTTTIEVSGHASASKYFGSAFTGLGGTNGCAGSDDTLNYNSTTGVFSCGSDASGGGGGSGTAFQVRDVLPISTTVSNVATISFHTAHFNISASGSTDAFIKLDWDSAGGPASLSQNETVTGLWNFNGASTQVNLLEFTTASASGNAVFRGTGSSSFAGSLNISRSATVTNSLTAGSVNTSGQINSTGVGSNSFSGSLNLAKGIFANTYNNGGLQTCNATTGKLVWNSGFFSCGTDFNTGGGAALQVRDVYPIGTTVSNVATISFHAAHFDVAASGSTDAFIKLDWTNGPASRTLEQTITKQWEFRNGASFTADLEVYDDSTTFIGGFASNSLGRFSLGDRTPETFFEIASSSGVVASISNSFFVDATNKRIGIGTSTPAVALQVVGAVSVSINFEVTGYASASQYFGANLTACNGDGQTLAWASGLFSCGDDDDTTSANLEVKEPYGGIKLNGIASLSFDGGKFAITASGSNDVKINLDWDSAGGPASLSQNETVTGLWNFNGASTQVNLLEFTTASASGNAVFRGTGSSSFAGSLNISRSATVTNSLTAGSVNTSGQINSTGVGSNSFSGSLNISKSLTAINSITAGSINTSGLLSALNASVSNNFEIGSNAFVIRSAGTSSSLPFETTSYASASQHFGGGLSTCNSDSQTLAWSSGTFSCGDDDSAIKTERSGTQSLAAATILNFDDGKFELTASGTTETIVNLDWDSAGGPASLSQDETITGLWNFSNGASFTTNIEVGGYASASKFFGSAFPTTGSDGCSGASDTLNWKASTGKFECGSDSAGGGGGATPITVKGGDGAGGTTRLQGRVSVSFDPNIFRITASNSEDVLIRLDWDGAGPASRAANETVTGFWEFRNGASFSNDLQIQNNIGSVFAIFASTSKGRFSLGDSTPEAYFEIASSSGVVASIANQFAIRSDSGVSLSKGFEITNGGYASASKYYGGGLTNCTGGSNAVQWTSSTGNFSCGTIVAAPTVKIASLSGTVAIADTITELLTVTITPSSTNNEILVTGFVTVDSTTANDQSIDLTLWRTSCSGTQVDGAQQNFNTVATALDPISVQGVDNPQTTSPVTYSLCALETTAQTAATNAVRMSISVLEVNIGADLAEIYGTNEIDLSIGNVVTIDPNLNKGVKKSLKTYDKNVLGIVSTHPALVIGGGDYKGLKAVPIALAGRVPIKVSTENGVIKPGDYLTSSTIPGVAMKATKTGPVVGQALSSFDGEDLGVVTVFVKHSYFNGTTLVDNAPDAETDGKNILTYLMNYAQDSSSSFSSEINTDRVTAGLEIITPQIVSNKIGANIISALTGNLQFVTGSVSFSETASGSPVITFDSLGNAFFAGDVTAKGINIGQINGLDIITQQITSLDNQIASISEPRENLSLNDLQVSSGLEVNGQSQFKGLTTFSENINILKNMTVEGQLSVVGSASIDGLLTAGKILAEEIESPTIADLKEKIDIITNFSNDLSDRIANIESASLNIEEILDTDGGLTIQGIKLLDGKIEVDEISSSGEYLALMNDVIFFGRPIFNSDAGGFATILKGENKVTVVFEKEYLENPIINVTMKASNSQIFEEGLNYTLNKEGVGGFTILLNKPAPFDIEFNWTALAVKDPKTFFSVKTTPTPEPTQNNNQESPSEPTPEATPELTPEFSEPELTPETIPEESPSPTPEITPELTPEITPTPEPMDSPEDSPLPSVTPLPTIEPAPEPTPEPEPTSIPEPILEPVSTE